jgi:hypothetical protein
MQLSIDEQEEDDEDFEDDVPFLELVAGSACITRNSLKDEATCSCSYDLYVFRLGIGSFKSLKF